MTREEIIQHYIKSYNAFDVEGMVRDFDRGIVFENIAGDHVTLRLSGIDAFKEQAEKARTYFTERTQTVTGFTHREYETEVELQYHAVLAVDIPNGPKKGEALDLNGKSIFRFADHKITALTDIA